MPNEPLYNSGGYDSKKSLDNSDYIHNPSTPHHCCDNDKCECHHPLRLWSVKYEVLGVPKFTGVATVQAKDLCDAEFVFIQNSKFNGMREYLKITCIDELYPNPEPLILQEDSAAILDKKILKTYPFLLRSEYDEKSQELNDTIIKNVQNYIGDIRPHIDSTTGNWFIGDQDTGVHAQGDKGEDGADGFSPSVSVSKSGNTTTISVKDEQGTTSSTITDGSNGESAYDIWLDQGNTGTEEDFLEWLRQGSYLKQIGNLDEYEGETNEIVQYIGTTNSKYTNGYVYKKVGTQIIIPAGTEYIDINDSSGNLASVGIPNGRYYSVIDETDTVKTKIRIHFASNASSYPIGRTIYAVPITGENTIDVRVGILGYASELSRVVSKERYQGNWRITFANGYTMNVPGRLNWGNDTLYSNVYIFENSDGIRIYTRPYFNNRAVFILEYIEDEDVYQVSAPEELFVYELKTTSSEQTIGTEEWQQWDVQPREDTSHFVQDTDLGWVEH